MDRWDGLTVKTVLDLISYSDDKIVSMIFYKLLHASMPNWLILIRMEAIIVHTFCRSGLL
jgi:hypothetical protein